MTDESRNGWNRWLIPRDMADAFESIAEIHGFTDKELHLFIYDMLRRLYAEDLERYKALYRLNNWKWDAALPPLEAPSPDE